MRIKEKDFDSSIREYLQKKESLSAAGKQALFSKADALLARRRKLLIERDVARLQWRFPNGIRGLLALLSDLARAPALVFRGLALHPAAQVALLLILTSLVFLLRSHSTGEGLRFADLPEIPKFNDGPARYDAMWRSEREAYEKEVEDAHRNTKGGI